MTRWNRAWTVESSPGMPIKGALAILPTFLQVWLDGLALLLVTRPLDEEFLSEVEEISNDEALSIVINANTRARVHELIEEQSGLNFPYDLLRWPMEPKDIFYVALVRSIRRRLTHSEDPNIADMLKRLEQTMWQNLYYAPDPELISYREFQLIPYEEVNAAGAEFVEKLFDARLGLKPWNPLLEREVRARHGQTDESVNNSAAKLPSDKMEKKLKFKTFIEILQVFAPFLAKDCLKFSSIGEFCFKRLCLDFRRLDSQYKSCFRRRDSTRSAIRSALNHFPFLFKEQAWNGNLHEQCISVSSGDRSSVASPDRSSVASPGISSIADSELFCLSSSDESSSGASSDLAIVEPIDVLPIENVTALPIEDVTALPIGGTRILDLSMQILDLSLPRADVNASLLHKRKATESISDLGQPQKRAQE